MLTEIYEKTNPVFLQPKTLMIKHQNLIKHLQRGCWQRAYDCREKSDLQQQPVGVASLPIPLLV